VALSPDAKALAQDMYQALWSFLICVTVTVVVSYATKPKPASELAGLVYGETDIPKVGDVPFYKKPLFWAAVVFAVFLILQVIFW
jgi:SSS family solute:Na+ symporter